MLVLIKYYMSVEQGTENLSVVFELESRDVNFLCLHSQDNIRPLTATVFSLSIEIFLKNLWRNEHNRMEHKSDSCFINSSGGERKETNLVSRKCWQLPREILFKVLLLHIIKKSLVVNFRETRDIYDLFNGAAELRKCKRFSNRFHFDSLSKHATSASD